MDFLSVKKIQIAVDGYSACGKSTLAKDLANQLNYSYIDSGAMYRAMTLFALQNNIINDTNVNIDLLIKKLPEVFINFKLDSNNTPVTYLNNKNVEAEIRKIEVSSFVSKISTIPEVRKKMVLIQQELGKDKAIVMDGRDIGTVVFPNAELKLFITADIDVRTKRRYEELIQKKQPVDFETIKENLIQRDRIDSTRSDSPLRKAEDAVVIDNSNITKEEQLEIAYNLALKAINK